jgi:hypothetical protein
MTQQLGSLGYEIRPRCIHVIGRQSACSHATRSLGTVVDWLFMDHFPLPNEVRSNLFLLNPLARTEHFEPGLLCSLGNPRGPTLQSWIQVWRLIYDLCIIEFMMLAKREWTKKTLGCLFFTDATPLRSEDVMARYGAAPVPDLIRADWSRVPESRRNSPRIPLIYAPSLTQCCRMTLGRGLVSADRLGKPTFVTRKAIFRRTKGYLMQFA